MKFFTLLLSLHSLRLIAVTVLVIVYLAFSAASSSTTPAAAEVENSAIAKGECIELAADNAGSIDTKHEIDTFDPREAGRK